MGTPLVPPLEAGDAPPVDAAKVGGREQRGFTGCRRSEGRNLGGIVAGNNETTAAARKRERATARTVLRDPDSDVLSFGWGGHAQGHVTAENEPEFVTHGRIDCVSAR